LKLGYLNTTTLAGASLPLSLHLLSHVYFIYTYVASGGRVPSEEEEEEENALLIYVCGKEFPIST
jgi:hypothetical protein